MVGMITVYILVYDSRVFIKEISHLFNTQNDFWNNYQLFLVVFFASYSFNDKYQLIHENDIIFIKYNAINFSRFSGLYAPTNNSQWDSTI